MERSDPHVRSPPQELFIICQLDDKRHLKRVLLWAVGGPGRQA